MYVFVADKSTSVPILKCAMYYKCSSDIALAHSFATGERGPVVFMLLTLNVYRMNYNGDDATSRNWYSPLLPGKPLHASNFSEGRFGIWKIVHKG